MALALSAVAWSPAAAQSGPGREIRGVVYDSLAGAPLKQASVSLLNRGDSAAPPRTVVADAQGRFEFSGVAPGVYLIGFQAPLLDSLGITSPTRDVRLSADGRGAVIANLATPSGRTVHDAFCPGRQPEDSTSAFIGHLDDPIERGVLAGGEIDATWVVTERNAKKKPVIAVREAQARSGPDGWFALCDLPAKSTIAVHAINGADTSGVIYLLSPATRGLVRREIYLASRSAAATGVLVGRVRSTEGGRAIAGAQIRADASGKTVTADDSGRFTLSGLPYGSSDLSVRAIGYLPQRVAVDVLAGAPTQLNVSLVTAANVLAAVRTQAYRTNDGFQTRRAKGWGRFYDADYIARIHAWDVNDIVRGTPGIMPMGLGFHATIKMRAMFDPRHGCTPTYYLDGKELQNIVESQDLEFYVEADDLAGVEVYDSATDTPPQFRDPFSDCGSIVMWTIYYKGNGH